MSTTKTRLTAMSRTELVEIVRQFCRENNLTIHPYATIKPGDFYVGCRNAGPQLLECRSVNHSGGWINPVGNAYAYDTHECVKVSINS